MASTHERKKCVNNVMFCADCGARIEGKTTSPAPVGAPSPEGEGMIAEKPKRRTAKKKGE